MPAAIIMVAKVCLRSWKMHLNPFVLQKAAKSFADLGGVVGAAVGLLGAEDEGVAGEAEGRYLPDGLGAHAAQRLPGVPGGGIVRRELWVLDSLR